MASKSVRYSPGMRPLQPDDIPEGDWIEWVKPSLWERLVYLFNPPKLLVLHIDDERWHRVSY